MLFHRPDYIVFLALMVAGFWALARRTGFTLRLGLLFLGSCAFYMAWKPEYIFLILGSTVLDYWVGGALHVEEDPRKRRSLLGLSLAGNLGLLFAFKYYNFFAMHAGMPLLEAALPVGISFYTFQTLSYTIDIYRGQLAPARNFVEFGAFVTYFPQLVAGPIVRASELLPQLQREPKLTTDKVSEGLFLIGTGLVKKVAIADFLAVNLVDRVFQSPDLFSSAEVVVALYAFTMQLYCDFSGYTDVARGSAMLMGFELPRNFDRPYQATSPAAFWRTWHMTLSRWLRDYLYFPLGGSRKGPFRAYLNLAITMFLVGIWHGWWQNFTVFFWYALLQTAAMVAHRFVHRASKRLREQKEKLAQERGVPVQGSTDTLPLRALKVFANLQFVVFSRILFRASSMENAEAITDRILEGTWILDLSYGERASEGWRFATVQIPTSMWWMLGLTFAAHYTPREWFGRVQSAFIRLPAVAQALALALVFAILSKLASAEAVPFIYFQF